MNAQLHTTVDGNVPYRWRYIDSFSNYSARQIYIFSCRANRWSDI